MLKKFRASASEFAHGTAGERFEARYHQARKAGHGMLRRCMVVSLGAVIFCLGIFFIPAPGPGLLIMLAGASLIAQESRAVAVRLDLAELRLRKAWVDIRRYWKRKATPGAKLALVLAAMCITGGMAATAYEIIQN